MGLSAFAGEAEAFVGRIAFRQTLTTCQLYVCFVSPGEFLHVLGQTDTMNRSPAAQT
jgi:hypothetical protein